MTMMANGSPNSNSSNDKVISPSKLAHVVLRTPRPHFKAMTAFYKAFLGARAAFENDDMAFLTYDAEHHRIALIAQPGCEPARVRDTAGLHHIAFTFDTLADLVMAYQQRRARQILPLWCVNHGPIYYQDPDGNYLETQVDNFDDMDAANAFVAGPQFAENPIGVDFDPDELADRLRAGEPEARLKKRPDIGPRTSADIPARFVMPPPPDVRESYEPVDAVT